MKADVTIKDEIYNMLKTSALVAEVTGKLYKRPRPTNSNVEDVCISVVANERSGDKQMAIAYIKVYVANIDCKGTPIPNDARIKKLCNKASEIIDKPFNGGDYRIEFQPANTDAVDGTNEHYISIKGIYSHSI